MEFDPWLRGFMFMKAKFLQNIVLGNQPSVVIDNRKLETWNVGMEKM